METRFYAEFTTREGTTFRINLLDADFTGTEAEGKVGPPGFELEYFGGQDVYSPLMPSTCRVPWIIQSTAEQAWLAELADFQEGRFLVEVIQDPDGTPSRHWVGVMSPDSVQIPDAARPFVIGLEAVCGLALLSRLDYDTSQQISGSLNNSTLDHVLNALRAIPGSTTDIFPLLSTMLLTVTDVRPATGTATDTFMQHVFFQAATNDIFQGVNTVGTYEDMLVQICVMMNARIYQRDGVWMLQSITKSMDAVNLITDVKGFDRLGTVTTTSNLSNFRKAINQTSRVRTNGAFGFLPAVRKVSRKIDFFGNAPFAGDSQIQLSYFANDGNTASPYSIGKTITGTADVTLPSTQTVRVTGFMRIFVPWFSGGINGVYQPLERVQRFRVRLKVKVGTKYLRRTAPYDFTYTTIEPELLYTPPGESSSDVEIFNPAEYGAYQWTTDSAARVDIWSEYVISGAQDFQGIARNTAVTFDFESPEIGSAEAASAEVTITFAGYHGEANSQNPDAFVSQSVKVAGCFAKGDFNLYLGDGSASADAITYGAELDNAATEELQLTPGLYGEVSSADIFIYNPAALLTNNFVSIPGFYSTVTTTTEPLAELVCIDRLKHFGAVQRSWQGTIYSSDLLDPFNTFTFDGAVWLPVQMSYSAEQDAYEIECIEVVALSSLDPDSVPQLREVGATQSPDAGINDVLQEQVNRGSRAQSDITETIADIETDVANINRTADASGGESSILLQYLGDVKISGPVAGQVLEYNDVANRWANVTPSGGGGGLGGNDQTLSADRLIDLDSHKLTFADGSTTKMAISTADGVQVFGNFYVDSGTVAGGALRLNEASLLGSNYIQIQAPLSVTADTVLTLPDGAGSSGQALTTNGSGTLSWVDVVAKVNPLVQNVLTISPLVSTSAPRVYIKGADNNGGVFLKVPDAISTDETFTLPDTDGSSGQALITDGAGALSFATVGSDLLPLAKISGRWMWSSVDDGERVMTGSTAYGPFNWYSHSNEPSDATIRVYSSSHTVNQTSGSMPGFYITAFGVPLGVDTKKVRVDFNFRVQNAPSGTTWGLSIWGANTPANGTTTSSTFTLRAVSSDISTTSTNSTAFYSGTVTSPGVIANDYILPMFENRSGSLNSTTYIYGQINIYLVG